MEGGARNNIVELCKYYANLHAEIQESTNDLRQVGAEIMKRIPADKSVMIAKNVVLAHITKAPFRKPITQIVLNNAGVSKEAMAEVLKQTAPDPSKRIHALKIMVNTEFKNMRPEKRKRETGGGNDSEEESEED
jgi:hypothetical protein